MGWHTKLFSYPTQLQLKPMLHFHWVGFVTKWNRLLSKFSCWSFVMRKKRWGWLMRTCNQRLYFMGADFCSHNTWTTPCLKPIWNFPNNVVLYFSCSFNLLVKPCQFQYTHCWNILQCTILQFQAIWPVNRRNKNAFLLPMLIGPRNMWNSENC